MLRQTCHPPRALPLTYMPVADLAGLHVVYYRGWACFAECGDKVRPQVDEGRDGDRLWQEVEYIEEGRNADRFRRNFRDVPWVRTPAVHWSHTSPRVITLDYMPGTKASADLLGLTPCAGPPTCQRPGAGSGCGRK